MDKELRKLLEKKSKTPKNNYFLYTTCPKCAKAYGENYVIGVAEFG